MRIIAISCLFAISFLVNVDAAISDTDVSVGERLYTQCTGCHAPDYNRTGPKHCGILGWAAGAVKDFEYTDAMVRSGIIWIAESLDLFLTSPFDMVPGTSMGFVGISSVRARQQLIAYLSQLDGSNIQCK